MGGTDGSFGAGGRPGSRVGRRLEIPGNILGRYSNMVAIGVCCVWIDTAAVGGRFSKSEDQKMIVVNFKAYEQATGEKAVNLAQICKQIADASGIRIVAVPQLADIPACAAVGIECWTQKYEPQVKGNVGTLLNHSDHRIDRPTLDRTLLELVGIEICICAASAKEAINLSDAGVDYVAFEPPDLIGNRDKSVSSERPEEIQEIVNSVRCPVLVGAGIHSAADVKASLAFGAKGILVATDIVLAQDPQKELRELAAAFKM